MRININNGIVTFEDENGIEAYEESGGGISYRPFKSDRGPIDAEREDFVWETHKGKRIRPEDMATPHIINAVNMIWKNVFKIKNDHPEIRSDWKISYLQRALDELTSELNKRIPFA